MNDDAAIDGVSESDWTRGGDRIVFQHCDACRHAWYFRRGFCPQCGATAPATRTSAAAGTVHATTLVHRAPTDEFRAAAPYRIVLVDVAEGFRMMGHGDAALAIGDAVRGRVCTIAGRTLPYFDKEPHES
ncbi:MAG: OB-fold domain-containing protein [Caldimonas sp.]